MPATDGASAIALHSIRRWRVRLTKNGDNTHDASAHDESAAHDRVRLRGDPRDVWQNVLLPEPGQIMHRETSDLPAVPIPANKPPLTVSNLPKESTNWPLTLDEAIRIALERTRVVRILSGTTAVASGHTIYDAAITHTTIDQAPPASTPSCRRTINGTEPTRRKRSTISPT